MIATPAKMGSIKQEASKFEAVPGFFAQGEPESDAEVFEYVRKSTDVLVRGADKNR